jgi:hypothetical protein
MYGFDKGSFVGSNFSSGQNAVPGRESNPTPFNYDENSLMNLSNSPSMYRSSNLTNITKNKEEKQMSSGRLNNRGTSKMG